MKIGDIRIEENDDGTYQVTCDVKKDSGQWCDRGELKYSATSLEDVITKIKEAKGTIGGMKEKKEKKNGPNRSVEKYAE